MKPHDTEKKKVLKEKNKYKTHFIAIPIDYLKENTEKIHR